MHFFMSAQTMRNRGYYVFTAPLRPASGLSCCRTVSVCHVRVFVETCKHILPSDSQAISSFFRTKSYGNIPTTPDIT